MRIYTTENAQMWLLFSQHSIVQVGNREEMQNAVQDQHDAMGPTSRRSRPSGTILGLEGPLGGKEGLGPWVA